MGEGNAVLLGNEIISNTASQRGGGLYLAASNARLIGNVVTGNISPGGSGLYIIASQPRLINNIITLNRSSLNGQSGNGLYVEGYYSIDYPEDTSPSNVTLIHNTFADNGDTAIVAKWFATVTLTNTIISGHSLGIRIVQWPVNIGAEHTLWHPGYAIAAPDSTIVVVTTTNDITGTPAFVNPNGFDYHISLDSDAIDAGVATEVTTDIDGEERPLGLGPDIGADEKDNRCATIEGWVFVDTNGNGEYDEWWQGEREGIGDVLISLNDGRTRQTSVDGWYGFSVAPGATYTVTETQPEGYTSTSPDSLSVPVSTCGPHINNNFGELLSTPTPTATSTGTPTATPTATTTFTPTATPTSTPSPTDSPTPTATPTAIAPTYRKYVPLVQKAD